MRSILPGKKPIELTDSEYVKQLIDLGLRLDRQATLDALAYALIRKQRSSQDQWERTITALRKVCTQTD